MVAKFFDSELAICKIVEIDICHFDKEINNTQMAITILSMCVDGMFRKTISSVPPFLRLCVD